MEITKKNKYHPFNIKGLNNDIKILETVKATKTAKRLNTCIHLILHNHYKDKEISNIFHHEHDSHQQDLKCGASLKFVAHIQATFHHNNNCNIASENHHNKLSNNYNTKKYEKE